MGYNFKSKFTRVQHMSIDCLTKQLNLPINGFTRAHDDSWTGYDKMIDRSVIEWPCSRGITFYGIRKQSRLVLAMKLMKCLSLEKACSLYSYMLFLVKWENIVLLSFEKFKRADLIHVTVIDENANQEEETTRSLSRCVIPSSNRRIIIKIVYLHIHILYVQFCTCT